MLEKGAVAVGQVASLAGYADPGSFSKAFRARYGCLPSEIRSTGIDLDVATQRK
jgi:AraC-like DNA-binding protein